MIHTQSTSQMSVGKHHGMGASSGAWARGGAGLPPVLPRCRSAPHHSQGSGALRRVTNWTAAGQRLSPTSGSQNQNSNAHQRCFFFGTPWRHLNLLLPDTRSPHPFQILSFCLGIKIFPCRCPFMCLPELGPPTLGSDPSAGLTYCGACLMC